MGEIVRSDEDENAKTQNLGDLLAEMAISSEKPVDSVQVVREIREPD